MGVNSKGVSASSAMTTGDRSVPALAVAYFATLAGVMLATRARFAVWALVVTTAAFLAYLASPWVKSSLLKLETVLSAFWLVFSIGLLIKDGLKFQEVHVWFVLFRAALVINAVCAAAYFALALRNKRGPRVEKVLLCVALVFIVFSFVFVLKASPNPHIDVFTICTEAVDLLRSGRNPYDYLYPDIYGGLFTYQPRFMYWPVVAYLVTLGKLVAGDVRAGNLLAYLLTALGLYLLGRRRQWDSRATLLAILVWFTYPSTFFVLEQAWVEPALMPSLVFFLYFADRRKWAAAAVMAGLACATKQYMLFFAVLSCFYVWRREGWRKTAEYAGIASGTTALAMLPFLVWNLRVFLDRTIFEILRYDIRLESLSWIAFSVRRWGAPLKNALSMALRTVLCVPALVVMARRRPVRAADLTLSLALVYSVVFLFASQALTNYYHFLGFLVFLHIILCADKTADTNQDPAGSVPAF